MRIYKELLQVDKNKNNQYNRKNNRETFQKEGKQKLNKHIRQYQIIKELKLYPILYNKQLYEQKFRKSDTANAIEVVSYILLMGKTFFGEK